MYAAKAGDPGRCGQSGGGAAGNNHLVTQHGSDSSSCGGAVTWVAQVCVVTVAVSLPWVVQVWCGHCGAVSSLGGNTAGVEVVALGGVTRGGY